MVILEKAMIDDAIEMTEINKRAFNDSSKRFGNGEESGPPGYDSIEVNSSIIRNNITYKILYANKIVGWFFVSDLGNYNFELSNLCVDPEYQNIGIGSKALEILEETIPYAKKWTLKTVPYSKRNHHFYEKMGYTKIGEEDGFFFLYEKLKK